MIEQPQGMVKIPLGIAALYRQTLGIFLGNLALFLAVDLLPLLAVQFLD